MNFPLAFLAKSSSGSPSFTLGKPMGSVQLDPEAVPTVSGETTDGDGNSPGKNTLQIVFDGKMSSKEVDLTKVTLEFFMEVDSKTGYWELKDLSLDYEVIMAQ